MKNVNMYISLNINLACTPLLVDRFHKKIPIDLTADFGTPYFTVC